MAGHHLSVSTPTVTSVATSLPGTTTTVVTAPSTTISPSTPTTIAPLASGPPVQNLEATPQVVDGLVTAFATAKGIDAADVAGPITGTLHYSYLTATGTYWATANFRPSSRASLPTQVSFQDGGETAMFSHRPGSAWSVTIGRIPNWPCPADVPAAVLTAWGMAYGDSCVFTSPTPAQLAGLVIDTSVLPQGFRHEDTRAGPGQATSVGQSLGNADGYWVREPSPPNQDDISVFLTLFSTPDDAINYNSVSSKEYMSDGPLLQDTTVPGVPASTAYLNGGSPGGGPGSSAQPLPPKATTWFNVGGVAVGIYVSDYQENPLPIAEHLAVVQYQRLYEAIYQAP